MLKGEEQEYIPDRTGTFYHSLIRREEVGMEGSIFPSKCNSRAQLGPQAILEGRSGKGLHRIKNRSHRLKLTDKMEAGRWSDEWLTMARGAVSEHSLSYGKQKAPREFRASFTTAIELCRYSLDR